MQNRRWDELTSQEQAGLVVAASVQFALAAAAWADLARRPAARVNGPKLLWAAIIAVNFVGPIAYFVLGRRRGGVTG